MAKSQKQPRTEEGLKAVCAKPGSGLKIITHPQKGVTPATYFTQVYKTDAGEYVERTLTGTSTTDAKNKTISEVIDELIEKDWVTNDAFEAKPQDTSDA